MSALPPRPSNTPPAHIFEAAARWYVRLNGAAASAPAADRQALQHWLEADALHREAWTRMLSLEQRLGAVPGDMVRPTLAGAKLRRRRLVGMLSIMLGTGALALASYKTVPWQALAADQRTRTGERRRITLADGGTLDINTDSAVDIVYSASLRKLVLHAGEILVQTAPDRPAQRPFEVHTAQGRIRALGTRFTVRSNDGLTQVAVLQDAVEVRPALSTRAALTLQAGQQARFSETDWGSVQPAQATQAEWANGKLIAIDQRLEDFIAELARYRPGRLVCDARVADLRISGAFRLQDTDAVLDNVAATLPVRLQYATRYWVRVEAL